jgi:hypothetical protein
MSIQANQGGGVTIFSAGGTGGGGGGTPGGSSGQLQYNASGSFAGMSGTSWNDTTRSLTLTGATVTTSAPLFDVTQTWNAGATTFTAIKMNVTDTASASASLLLDLQVGGTSQFSVSKSGQAIAADGTAAAPALRFSSDSGMGFYRVATNTLGISFSSAVAHVLTAASYRLRANSGIYTLGTSDDVLLSRAAAASLQLGAADAAAPVAQTLGVQSVVAGTTNTAGTNFTIKGSAGTGTGAGGSIIFQVAPAGSSGTSQNALSTALTIASDLSATFAGSVIANTLGSSSGGTSILSFNTARFSFGGGGSGANAVQLRSDGLVTWAAAASIGGASDTILLRDAANTLALRNGTAAQAFRVYGTYNGTNDEWIQLDHGVTSANTATILSTKTGSGVARAIEMQVGTARKIRFSTTGGWELINGATREGYFNWDAFTVRSDAYVGFASSTTVPGGQGDTNLIRVGAAIMGIRGGSTTTGGVLSLIEQTAPAAPAANGVYIYAEDNGSGKTRLMALFATGAAQQIAIEP